MRHFKGVLSKKIELKLYKIKTSLKNYMKTKIKSSEKKNGRRTETRISWRTKICIMQVQCSGGRGSV